MTRAPATLLAVSSLLLTHLDNAPGPDDLDPVEVGVVGDTAHQQQGDSYHLGKPQQRTTGYSVTESPRDKAGLSDLASALDIGEFRVDAGGRTYDLRHFSAWCVAQCVANAPDTRDIREIIFSPDGTTVKRWDRLGKRSSGDSSHRWHTHISFFRDAIKAGRNQTPLFRRYLTTIGLIRPATPKPTEDTMEQNEKLTQPTAYEKRTVGHVLADLSNLRDWLVSPVGKAGLVSPPAADSPLALLLADVSRDDADEAAIVEGVLGGLGTKPAADVAQALVAAGQDPAKLAVELSKLVTATG
ncbi:hypothetical protein ACFYPX_18070 [Micromonospora zamorensis]|uniref:hypothetical protein n=1 Tax=Micromonospora zamorensis TaxID=709883 RepID=UPI0036C59500